MKSVVLIYLILFNCFQMKADFESVFKAIKDTKGNFINDLRKIKKNFEGSKLGFDNVVEKTIKDIELMYITDEIKLKNHLEELYISYEDKNKDDEFNEYVHDFLQNVSKFCSIYEKMNETEKVLLLKEIEEMDPFHKNLFLYFIENSYFLNNDNFTLEEIFHLIPSVVTTTSKHKVHKPNKIKMKNDLKKTLNNLNDDLNLHEIDKHLTFKEKNEKMKEIKNKLTSEHHDQFSSFLEEYIDEHLINNDDLKEEYTLNRIYDINLSKMKHYQNKQNIDKHLTIDHLKKRKMKQRTLDSFDDLRFVDDDKIKKKNNKNSTKSDNSDEEKEEEEDEEDEEKKRKDEEEKKEKLKKEQEQKIIEKNKDSDGTNKDSKFGLGINAAKDKIMGILDMKPKLDETSCDKVGNINQGNI